MTREEKTAAAVKRADRLLTAFRSAIGDTVPMQVAHTFLTVARNEGQGVTELAAAIGASKSTMSRHLLDLSGTLRSGAEGYGLLNRTPDPTNLRGVIYTINAKGRLLLNQIADILED